MYVLFHKLSTDSWEKVFIADDSPVAKALEGEPGERYDHIRKRYKKPILEDVNN